MIQELGGKFTLSDDSHGPGAVGLNYQKLFAYLKENQINDVYVLKKEGGKIVQKKVENVLSLPQWSKME